MKLIRTRLLSLALCCALAIGCVSTLSGCASMGESNGTIPSVPGNPTEEQTQQPEEEPEEIIPLDCDPLTGAQLPEGTTDLRPVAVMLDNSNAALPHSGVAAASVVYEMVTEGGIPRLMAVYPSAQAMPEKVGPVRSTRDQFLQLLIPENMILIHIGSSIYAANMLNIAGYPTVDGMYLGPIVCAFDEARGAVRDNSHCFYTGSGLAAAGIAHKEIPTSGTVNRLFSFLSYEKEPLTPDKQAINVEFSFSQIASVRFAYNAEAARYYKTEYGNPQMDELTGEQVSFTNLFLLGCPVGLKQDGLCTDFTFTSGEGFYFTRGAFQPVRWEKGELGAPLRLFDADGKELHVNVGTSYVAFVDERALEGTLFVDAYSPYAAD